MIKNTWGLDRNLKILDCSWHLSHQYEYMKLPNTEWYWLIQHRRLYNNSARGDMVKKFNIKWTPYYEKGLVDLVILHLDQQCLSESLYAIGKGSVYREMNEVIQDIPKIVIMHGTPYWPEEATPYELKKRLEKIIGDNVMVVNSHKAKEQWGRGHTIIHGLDPNEWFNLPKEPRVVTMISPAGLDKYYDRQFLQSIREELEERDIMHCHISVDKVFNNFEDYREFLGRSLIYINPTKESPMPRARTEAMMSGCCVLTTPWQDADTFIKDGINGFIIKRNPYMVADLVEELLNDYNRAVRIGENGRKTSLELFTLDRFLNDWTTLIKSILKL